MIPSTLCVAALPLTSNEVDREEALPEPSGVENALDTTLHRAPESPTETGDCLIPQELLRAMVGPDGYRWRRIRWGRIIP